LQLFFVYAVVGGGGQSIVLYGAVSGKVGEVNEGSIGVGSVSIFGRVGISVELQQNREDREFVSLERSLKRQLSHKAKGKELGHLPLQGYSTCSYRCRPINQAPPPPDCLTAVKVGAHCIQCQLCRPSTHAGCLNLPTRKLRKSEV